MGCFIFLMPVCLVAQSCLTLCNPLDSSPPGSSVRGIFQTRILAWVVISFSRGSSWPRDQTCVSCVADRFFTGWAIREALIFLTVWQLGSKWKSMKEISRSYQFSLVLDWKIVSFFCCIHIQGKGKQSPPNGRNDKNTQPPWINQHFLDQLFYRTAAKSLQSCLTLWPHRERPTRLPSPWDSPGKNTGVGCHFLLQFYRTDYLIFVFSLWKYCNITIKGRVNERECSHNI